MAEPVVYSSSREADRIPGFHDPADETLPKQPIIGDNPLNSFETYHTQVKTDLNNWMTFSQEARERKAKAFQEMTANDERLKLDMDRRCKILNYIIWIESHHPLGSSYVAAIAFKGLFPQHRARPAQEREQ